VYFVVGDNIFDTNVVDAVDVSLDDRNFERFPSENKNGHENNGHSYGHDKNHKKNNCTNKYSKCVGHTECCVGACVHLDKVGKVCSCNEISQNCKKSDNDTCCQGFCDSKSATCKCIDTAGYCKSDKECCKGNCIKDRCVCAASGGACKVTNDCCGGICKNGICGTCSYPTSLPCITTDDCCRGVCDPVSHRCICGTTGNKCKVDQNCCGGVCNNGTCSCLILGINSIGCDPINDNCCYGTCAFNSTANVFQCLTLPVNSECNQNADCTTFYCVNNRCSCYTTGTPCSVTVQCCQGLTCTNTPANATLLCQ